MRSVKERHPASYQCGSFSILSQPRLPHWWPCERQIFLDFTLRHAITNTPAVLMPDFWPTEAALWFRLLENQLSYCKITTQFTRFAILTPYLTEGIALQVSDVLIRPFVDTPYEDLSSAPLYAQFSFRSEAAPMKNKQVFYKAQNFAYASTEEVELIHFFNH